MASTKELPLRRSLTYAGYDWAAPAPAPPAPRCRCVSRSLLSPELTQRDANVHGRPALRTTSKTNPTAYVVHIRLSLTHSEKHNEDTMLCSPCLVFSAADFVSRKGFKISTPICRFDVVFTYGPLYSYLACRIPDLVIILLPVILRLIL